MEVLEELIPPPNPTSFLSEGVCWCIRVQQHEEEEVIFAGGESANISSMARENAKLAFSAAPTTPWIGIVSVWDLF